MPILTSCPSCNRQLRVPEELIGKAVKCPTCFTTFTASEDSGVPESRPVAPPPAEGYYGRGGEEEYGDFERQYEDRPRRGGGARGLDGLTNNYSINAGEWFNYAGQHYSSVLGPMIGYIIIVFVIDFALGLIPFVGPLVRIFVDPALQAGYAVVLTRQLSGRRWEFGDFFGGFKFYGPIMGNYLLMVVIILGMFLPTIIAFFAVLGVQALDLQRGGGGPAAEEKAAMMIFVGVLALNFLAAIYFIVRLTAFSTQLIVDRECGPIEAIKGSWIISRGHFWGLFGMSLLIGIVSFIGIVGCLIGILFTIPYGMLAMNAGYLLIAGSRPPVNVGEGSRGRRRDEDDDFDDRPNRYRARDDYDDRRERRDRDDREDRPERDDDRRDDDDDYRRRRDRDDYDR